MTYLLQYPPEEDETAGSELGLKNPPDADETAGSEEIAYPDDAGVPSSQDIFDVRNNIFFNNW